MVPFGMKGQVPPTTRVVGDLDAAHQSELVAAMTATSIKIQDGTVAKHVPRLASGRCR